MQAFSKQQHTGRLGGGMLPPNRLLLQSTLLAVALLSACTLPLPAPSATPPAGMGGLTHTVSPSPSPAAGCAALQAGPLVVSPASGGKPGGLETTLTNAGAAPLAVLGAALESSTAWGNAASPPPGDLHFSAYYFADRLLLDPSGSDGFPLRHRFPPGKASLLPGRSTTLRWEFDRSLYTKLDTSQFPGIEAQLFYWSGGFKAALDYETGGHLCSLVLAGNTPPEITLQYSGGSAAIYTPFWVRAGLQGTNLPEVRSLGLFVHDAAGKLVHRHTIDIAAHQTASLCLFGGEPDCTPRRPYQQNWDPLNGGKGEPILPGAYTLTVLAVTASGSLLQPFSLTIAAPRPAALTAAAASPTTARTRTPAASALIHPPGYTPPSGAPPPLLPGAVTGTPVVTLTLPGVPALSFTPTITQTPTITRTPTPAITATASKTATRELTPTPTFCQTPLEGGGCQ
ncbi:MAG: hypothetical protein IT308_07055 [Anaerolineaceae bacterium]|nr:hypothetical protein [Anaerolineaceae bacterium]